MPEAAARLEPDEFEQAVEEVIAEHGDARAAVRALLATCRYLEQARDRMADLVSFGYVRGKLSDDRTAD
jgi:hypothetical protein